MFERGAIARAVDLQARSYKLLRWMTDAIDRGFIAFGDAHEFASLSAAKELALELDRTLSDEVADELLNDRAHHEAAGLVAYAHDLARRLDGVTGNPATLVLWRSFAWDEVGAPKPDFRLTPEMVLDAEAKLVAAIAA